MDDNKKTDQILVLNDLPNGDIEGVRFRNGQAEFGTLVKNGSGEGEAVSVSLHDDHPDLLDVTPRASSSHGPARVNSTAYRSGWDSIFGQKKSAELN